VYRSLVRDLGTENVGTPLNDVWSAYNP